MDERLGPNEKLLRAVWPPTRRPNFWVNGRLSSAALKDKYGLSVDRTFDRTVRDAVEVMKKRLQGFIVSFTVLDCSFVNAYVKYCPSESNDYHCEIHGSKSDVMLSDEQALILARAAVLEYEPNAEYKI